MIHWLWIIPAFMLGVFVGAFWVFRMVRREVIKEWVSEHSTAN